MDVYLLFNVPRTRANQRCTTASLTPAAPNSSRGTEQGFVRKLTVAHNKYQDRVTDRRDGKIVVVLAGGLRLTRAGDLRARNPYRDDILPTGSCRSLAYFFKIIVLTERVDFQPSSLGSDVRRDTEQHGRRDPESRLPGRVPQQPRLQLEDHPARWLW